MSAPPTASSGKKRLTRALGAIAAAAVMVGAGVYYCRFVMPFESTDDAFIEGHVTAIASQVPGRVSQLLVEDNQQINKGDLLLQIDPSDYETRLGASKSFRAECSFRSDTHHYQKNSEHPKTIQTHQFAGALV